MVSAENVAISAGQTQAPMAPDVIVAVPGRRLSEGSSSLSRRSRVRRRNSRRDEDSSSDIISSSGDISSSQLFVRIPPADAHPGSSPKSLSALETSAPPRPPRSPHRLQSAPALGNNETNPDQRIPRPRTRSIDPSTTRPAIDDIRGRQTRSENGQLGQGQRPRGVSLPRHAFRNNSGSDSSGQPSPLTPNAFNDNPAVPIFAQNRRFRHQPRDSGFTQQSTTSSSLYPKSTSTEGSYPSPPSLPAQDLDDCRIVTVDPADETHLDALHDMDADEVSYRLRLLMQNNYYLPPAHSKPFSEIPSDIPKKSPIKSSSPTFFDIFKVVKKKSSLSTDNKGTTAPSAPILRTTSDSSTLSGLLRPQQAAIPTRRLRVSHSLPKVHQEPKGRVVVVRERMDDLESMARQAEQELKAREIERQQNASETSHSQSVQAPFVDPTDSVDLPLVPSNEFFGPQAALLRGMGIDSSIGAALLADQLPPSSPGSWSAESEDAAWRRAILHAAVDHSLNSSLVETPARSITSSSQARAPDLSSAATPTTPFMLSPSIASPASTHPPLPSLSTNDAGQSCGADVIDVRKKPILGQPILSRIIDEVANIEASTSAAGQASTAQMPISHQPADGQQKVQRLLVTTEPDRASSPTAPTTPLRPPPRRPSQTPLNSSGSGSDNAQDRKGQVDDSPLEVDAGHLHTEEAAPIRLSDAYESHVGLSGAFGKLTPPGSQHNSAMLSTVKTGPGDSSGFADSISTTSGSYYSDDEGEVSTFHTPQEQTLASTFAGSRPSLRYVSEVRESCDSSQPSPTTSAFRDAYDRSRYSESSANLSDVNTLGGNSRGLSHASTYDDPRYAVVTPPPRVSSMHARDIPGYSSRPHRNEQDERRTPTTLHVPRLTARDLLAPESHSSYTASPISFFDAVEMQSQQEDEDESSESDNSDETGSASMDIRDDVSMMSSSLGAYQSDSARVFSSDPHLASTHSLEHDPRHTLGALLQQRNASLPQLGSNLVSSERNTGLGFDSLDRWRAISNEPRPPRPSFWSKKHGKRHEIFPNAPRVSESTADWVKREEAKETPAAGKRPQTAGSRVAARESRSGEKLQDPQDPSVRRLDGLLIEHMEREKEVLKRITTTISKTST